MDSDNTIPYDRHNLEVEETLSLHDSSSRNNTYRRVPNVDSSNPSGSSINIPGLGDLLGQEENDDSYSFNLPIQESKWYSAESILGISANNSKLWNISVMFLVISVYWATSMILVFSNKTIFQDWLYPFPYPLFLTWFQLICALVLLFMLGELSKFHFQALRYLPPPVLFDIKTAKKVYPLALIYLAMLSLNNICLNNAEVTFYQVVRSLTIPLNAGASFIITKKMRSLGAYLACLTIVLGFSLGSFGEHDFTFSAFFAGIFSSISACLYGIYTKKFLSLVNHSEWVLLQYNTIIAVLLGAPLLFISGELIPIAYIWFLGELRFWWFMVLAGILGLFVNISTYLQTRIVTPLTCTISGSTKILVTAFVASVLFQNNVSSQSWIGIILISVGSFLYSYTCLLEARAAAL